MVKQADQVGVVDRVVDDEAGIDPTFSFRRFDINRMGVASEAIILLKQRDIMSLVQQPSRRQS